MGLVKSLFGGRSKRPHVKKSRAAFSNKKRLETYFGFSKRSKRVRNETFVVKNTKGTLSGWLLCGGGEQQVAVKQLFGGPFLNDRRTNLLAPPFTGPLSEAARAASSITTK